MNGRHLFYQRNLVLTLGLLLALLTGCTGKMETGFVSSATLESDTWDIAPSQTGILTLVAVREGDSVSAGQRIAQIDTVPLSLKLAEIRAAGIELGANVAAKRAEKMTFEVAEQGVERELERARKLLKDSAITSQKVDDLQTQWQSAKARTFAASEAIRSLESRTALLKAQENSIRDQINRCTLTAPANGRILTRYRNSGEAAIIGRPIVQMGRTDSLWADLFISQPMLSGFRLGQKLRIRVDGSKEAVWLAGQLIWISDEAEFTPKGVQTREGRNELVFRARVLVANAQGMLKRGMLVEIYQE